MPKYTIYLVFNQDNGKGYVGRTERGYWRIYEHFKELRLGCHKNIQMQNEYQNRKRPFAWCVIEQCDSWDEAKSKEYEWIVRLKTYESSQGYNNKDSSLFYRGTPTKRLAKLISEVV